MLVTTHTHQLTLSAELLIFTLLNLIFLYLLQMSRLLLSLFLCLLVGGTVLKATNPHDADIEDNDFAEFEEFDDDGMIQGFFLLKYFAFSNQ